MNRRDFAKALATGLGAAVVAPSAVLEATERLKPNPRTAGGATSIATGTAAGRPEYTVPPSIDKTGATDVSVDLFDFLNSIPDHSDIHFQELGIYNCEWPLNIYAKTDVRFFGHGAKIKAFTDGTAAGVPPASILPWIGERRLTTSTYVRNRYHLVLSYLTHCHFEDLYVEGSAGVSTPNGVGVRFVSELEAQHAWLMLACIDVEMINCRADQVFGDCVFVWGGRRRSGSGAHWSRDIYIQGGQYTNSRRQGITPIGVKSMEVCDLVMGGHQRSLVDIEPPGLYPNLGCIDFHMHDVVVSGYHDWFLSNAGGSYVVNQIVMENITAYTLASTSKMGIVEQISNPRGPGKYWKHALKGPVTIRGCVGTAPSGVAFAAKTRPLMWMVGTRDMTCLNNHQDCTTPHASGKFISVHDDQDFLGNPLTTTSNISGNTGWDVVEQAPPESRELVYAEGEELLDLPQIFETPELPPYPLPV